MLRNRFSALASALAITVTSTAAMAWETFVPMFNGPGAPYAWTTARIRDVATFNLSNHPWVSFDQSITEGCNALRRVDPCVGPHVMTYAGQTEFHAMLPGDDASVANTALFIILWAKAQNMPVRIRLGYSDNGGRCVIESIQTCSDPATCADPPTNL